MTKLSVNINKFATLRNARGGNNPDLVQVAIDCERFGADVGGIGAEVRGDVMGEGPVSRRAEDGADVEVVVEFFGEK